VPAQKGLSLDQEGRPQGSPLRAPSASHGRSQACPEEEVDEDGEEGGGDEGKEHGGQVTIGVVDGGGEIPAFDQALGRPTLPGTRGGRPR
jgi:hypothetical protein